MNLLKKKKDPKIADKLAQLPLEVWIPAEYSDKNSIRTTISREVKDLYPDMKFETRVEREKKKFYIKRIA